ncbi:BCCT family transporter [Escherichia coli]
MRWPTPWLRPVRVISRKVTILTVGLRLFWCVVITLIPLSILFTGASLETMKTTVVLTALPFLVILLVKVGGLFAG